MYILKIFGYFCKKLHPPKKDPLSKTLTRKNSKENPLPKEVWLNIFSYLSHLDSYMFVGVDKMTREIVLKNNPIDANLFKKLREWSKSHPYVLNISSPDTIDVVKDKIFYTIDDKISALSLALLQKTEKKYDTWNTTESLKHFGNKLVIQCESFSSILLDTDTIFKETISSQKINFGKNPTTYPIHSNDDKGTFAAILNNTCTINVFNTEGHQDYIPISITDFTENTFPNHHFLWVLNDCIYIIYDYSSKIYLQSYCLDKKSLASGIELKNIPLKLLSEDKTIVLPYQNGETLVLEEKSLKTNFTLKSQALSRDLEAKTTFHLISDNKLYMALTTGIIEIWDILSGKLESSIDLTKDRDNDFDYEISSLLIEGSYLLIAFQNLNQIEIWSIKNKVRVAILTTEAPVKEIKLEEDLLVAHLVKDPGIQFWNNSMIKKSKDENLLYSMISPQDSIKIL